MLVQAQAGCEARHPFPPRCEPIHRRSRRDRLRPMEVMGRLAWTICGISHRHGCAAPGSFWRPLSVAVGIAAVLLTDRLPDEHEQARPPLPGGTC